MLKLNDIEQAAARLEGQLLNTPCVESKTLSQLTGAQIYLKFENLQYTASFKERGACNKLAQLTAAERRSGVIAMSAGNHAQGVFSSWPSSRVAACSISFNISMKILRGLRVAFHAGKLQ